MAEHRRVSRLSLALGLALAGLTLLLLGMSRAQTPVHPVVPAALRAPAIGEGGIAAFTSRQLSAGVTDTFCLVYTATSPITTTGGIRVVDPNFHGTRWGMSQQFQTTSPGEAGYPTVTTTGSAALLIERLQSNPQ
jgi:hypothetical protein